MSLRVKAAHRETPGIPPAQSGPGHNAFTRWKLIDRNPRSCFKQVILMLILIYENIGSILNITTFSKS